MKIVGIFDTNEETVGNRLSGIQTYLAKTEKQILDVLDKIEKNPDVRNNCI